MIRSIAAVMDIVEVKYEQEDFRNTPDKFCLCGIATAMHAGR